MSNDTFKCEVLFGYVQLDSGFRVGADGCWYGQSRKRTYDQAGHLLDVTEWQDSGARLIFPDDERPSLMKRLVSFVGW